MRFKVCSWQQRLLSTLVVAALLLGSTLHAAANAGAGANELARPEARGYQQSNKGSATPTPEPTPTAEAGATVEKTVEDKGDVVQTEEGAAEAAPAGDGEAVTSLDDAQMAVVQIVATGTFADPAEGIQANAAGAGTGFIIDPAGIAVTNNHVVTGAAFLKVYVQGEDEPRSAKVLGVSECSDLAVIDIRGDGFPYLEWSDKTLKVGLEVYAAGFPLGDPEYTLTRGIIAKAKAAGDTPWASVEHVVQHDADINPGNSGGPLLDVDGRVVAVNYASLKEANQYFAIAQSVAAPVIETLAEGSDVDSLGINGQAIQVDETLSGVWVASVASGSTADQAGVKPGDFITALENVSLASEGTMSEYCDILRSHDPGDTLNLQVMRMSSNEMLEGQMNGRILAPVSSLENVPEGSSTGSGVDYDEYTAIQDESGLLSMEVPAEWDDTGDGEWTSNDEPIGYRLAGAINLDKFFEGWDTSGVVLSLSAELAKDTTAEELADQIDYSEACTGDKERDEINEGYFQGYIDFWPDCGDNKNSAVVIAVAPESGAYLLLLEMVGADERDGEALKHIWGSVAVNEDVLNTLTTSQTEIDPDNYTEISDDSGLLTVSVPNDWTDSNGGNWTSNDKAIGYALSAAPDLDAYYKNWDEPGMFFGASANLAQEMDYRGLLEDQDFSNDCTYDERIKYDDGSYVGAYDVWTDCGGKGNRFMVLAANPKDDTSVLIMINVAIPANTSDEPFRAILASFKLTDQVGLVESGATATVQSATLNVRSGPGTNFGRISSVAQGDVLTVNGQVNNCGWLNVVTPNGKEGWVSGAGQYVSLDGDCADLPELEAPAAPAGGSSGSSGGGSAAAGKGCITFRNNLGAELTITLTRPQDGWNKTIKVAGKAQGRECLDPAKYTMTVDAPPPWSSFNDEFTMKAGDNFPYDINPGN